MSDMYSTIQIVYVQYSQLPYLGSQIVGIWVFKIIPIIITIIIRYCIGRTSMRSVVWSVIKLCLQVRFITISQLKYFPNIH